MTTAIVKVDKKTVTEIERLEGWAKTLVIHKPEERELAMDAVRQIKARCKNIIASFKENVQAAYAAHKAAVAHRDRFLKPLQDIESRVKDAVMAYDEEVKRQAEQERKRLQAIADEKARKEREKAERAAAKQRQREAEQKAKAREAERAAKAAKDKAERERLEKEANIAKARAELAAEKAAAKDEAAASVVNTTVQVAAPVQHQGEITRSTWRAEVIDLALVPREYLVPNQAKLDLEARTSKGKAQIPGVKMIEKKHISVRN